jgi:hypothetical protein
MIRSKSKIGSSTFTEFNKIINSFHDIFLYGQEMFILHKDRPKKMNVYLDHKRDKLIWISSQTKAFIIDLYFANVNYRETSDLIKMGA